MPMIDAVSEPHAAPVRILVVEDEPLVRMAIAMELRLLGVVVIEAATGDEAWDYLMSHEPVDLIFTDYQMPGRLNGAQLGRLAREAFPGLRVVVASARVTAPDDWLDPIMGKPYDLTSTAAGLMSQARISRGDV